MRNRLLLPRSLFHKLCTKYRHLTSFSWKANIINNFKNKIPLNKYWKISFTAGELGKIIYSSQVARS